MTPQIAELTLEAFKENWNLIPVLADLYEDLRDYHKAEKLRSLEFNENFETMVALDFLFAEQFKKAVREPLKVWRAYCEKNKDRKYWKEWLREYCVLDTEQNRILKCVLDKNLYNSNYGILAFQRALAAYRKRFINIDANVLKYQHDFCLLMGDRITAQMWRALRMHPWRLTNYEVPEDVLFRY